jgi:putative ABC transport system ATP-binding protein
VETAPLISQNVSDPSAPASNTGPAQTSETATKTTSPSDTIVTARDLSKTYGIGPAAVVALHEVSFRIHRGRTVALLGRSGSGKSTLLNLLGAVDRPTTGSIEVGGTDLAKLSDADLALFRRRSLGFVFQSFYLLLDRLGLQNLSRRYPDQLSGGQQQRVALARAIVHRPELILADEPTGNLDAHSGRIILDLLIELHREFNITVIMATHSPDAAGRCDDSIHLEDGRITRTTGKIEVLP